jgi:hypothetical protein
VATLTQTPQSGYTPTDLTDEREAKETREDVVLAWRIHRLREEPQKIGLVALGYGLAFAFWRLAFPYPLGLFLPLVALTGAMSEYLFPVNYKLTSKGAYCSCGPAIKLEMLWSDVRRATKGKDGVYLSTLKIPSRLDSFRGIRLRFSQGNDEKVRETVRTLWKQGEST